MGYSEDGITHKDISRLNELERERVADADNLFVSLKMAAEGDSSELEKQIYMHYYAHKGSLHANVRFTDRRLSYLVQRMKMKYADEVTSTESLQIGSQKYGGVIDRKAFEASEIDDLMINFLFSFNDGFIMLDENKPITVSSIYSFEGENDIHSNNKLMSYICGDDKVGMFEVGILWTMEKRKGTTRHTQNKIVQKIHLNDLDEVRYEDINTPMDVDGNRMMVDDLIGGLDESYSLVDGEVKEDRYQPTDEFRYIRDNLKSVLTKNQYEKFEIVVKAIETGEVDTYRLFHPVTGELVRSELGKLIYENKKNNYIQSQVDSLLNSMRNRMNAAIKLQGFEDDVPTLESDYRKLKSHSLEDNRLYADYGIYEKYAIRDLYVDEFHKQIDVTFQNSDQFIPYDVIEKIQSNEVSVSDVIREYKLTKKDVNNPHGAVKTFVLSKSGKSLFTDDEMIERENSHCRQLLEWIREGRITFNMNDSDDGYVKPSSHKLNDITYEDYKALVERPLIMIDDVKELEIIRSAMDRNYFNKENRYVLTDSYYVDYRENQYTDLKNYDHKKYIEDVSHNEKTINNGNKADVTIDEKIAVVI